MATLKVLPVLCALVAFSFTFTVPHVTGMPSLDLENVVSDSSNDSLPLAIDPEEMTRTIVSEDVSNLDLNPVNKISVNIVSYGSRGFKVPSDSSYGGYMKYKIFGMKEDESTGLVSSSSPPSSSSSSQDSNPIVVNIFMNEPPPYYETAKMARYIVLNSNWSSVATISAREPTVGWPFTNIVSISDGPRDKSTGVPYMYVTDLDVTMIDLKKDSRATLTMSLVQGDYCSEHSLDPEDPRCARVIFTGNVVKLGNGTAEEAFARQAMFSKHPTMESWPLDHGFYFAKLDIKNIFVLDYFGGVKTVDVKDYYKARVYL